MEKPLGYTAPSDSPALSVRPTPPGETATWKDFIALTKPGIIRSNVIAVFAGFWLASQWDLQYGKLIWTILGAVLVMASSCVFNNYFDRDFDMKMERTKKRALPTGKLSPRIVLWYAIILGIFGLAVLFSFSGLLAGLFGAVGMFVYVVVYTLWLKRTSTWSTSIGAISGAMPPVIGYVAVTGKVDLGAWLLFALLFLWQPPSFPLLSDRLNPYGIQNHHDQADRQIIHGEDEHFLGPGIIILRTNALKRHIQPDDGQRLSDNQEPDPRITVNVH